MESLVLLIAAAVAVVVSSVVVLCVDVSSSVMMEEEVVAGVAIPDVEETLDRNGGGGRRLGGSDRHFSHVTKRGHVTLGGVYCDDLVEMVMSSLLALVSSDVWCEDDGRRSCFSNVSKQTWHICAEAATLSSCLGVMSSSGAASVYVMLMHALAEETMHRHRGNARLDKYLGQKIDIHEGEEENWRHFLRAGDKAREYVVTSHSP